MTDLYTTSKKNSRPWDGNKLGLMNCTSELFISNFFENKNLAGLVTYDINLDAQHLFSPGLYDRILPTDDLEENAMVVGNAMDKIGFLMPMKTPNSILNHVPVVVKKSNVHPIYSKTTPLPKMHLKGTIWEKEDDNYVIFMVPVAMPLPFGVTVPYGNLNEPEYMRSVKALGSEYEFHAEAIYSAMKHHQDVDKIVQAIVSKGQQDNYLPGYGVEVTCNKVPYVQLSLFRDAQECPGAMEDISSVFAPKKTEPSAAPMQMPPMPTMAPQTIVIAKPEDDEKKRLDEMNLHRLTLFFASDNNTSFDKGSSNFENGLTKPQWSDSFQEILDLKGETRVSAMVDMVEDIFSSSVGAEMDIFQEKSAITDAASFMFFPKNAAAQLLKGNFCSKPFFSSLFQLNRFSIFPSLLFP